MKLYGTTPSHFTRKVRILLAELGQAFEFIELSNLLQVGPEHFAKNPLHMFPVLEDGERWLIESDVICEYLIEHYGKASGFAPYPASKTHKYEDLIRLSIINGAMEAGVHRIRAVRSEIKNIDQYAFFQQEKAAMQESLKWLDRDLGTRTSFYPNKFTYLDVSLLCLAEWAVFREQISSLVAYPNIQRFVEHHQNRPSCASTHPTKGA